MKKLLFKAFMLLTILTLASCKLSTNELAKEVKISMQEEWGKQELTGIKITSFMLTHKSGNEYSGILETDEDGETFKYTVEVIYDGENFQWEIIE